MSNTVLPKICYCLCGCFLCSRAPILFNHLNTMYLCWFHAYESTFPSCVLQCEICDVLYALIAGVWYICGVGSNWLASVGSLPWQPLVATSCWLVYYINVAHSTGCPHVSQNGSIKYSCNIKQEPFVLKLDVRGFVPLPSITTQRIEQWWQYIYVNAHTEVTCRKALLHTHTHTHSHARTHTLQ
jgi:hypothetical protein